MFEVELVYFIVISCRRDYYWQRFYSQYYEGKRNYCFIVCWIDLKLNEVQDGMCLVLMKYEDFGIFVLERFCK